MKETSKGTLQTVIKIVAIVLVFIVASFLLSRLLGFLTILELYHKYLNILHLRAGLNPFLSNALALIIVIPVFSGISLLFSFRKKRRSIGWGLIIAFFVCFNLGMYALTKDDFFSRIPKEPPFKYFVKTVAGYKFSDAPGLDPDTGETFEPVTPEVKKYYDQTKNGVHQVVNPDRLFNPVTREAVVWYYRTPEGTYDLFDGPGAHPRYGVNLNKITPEEALRYDAWLAAKKQKEEAARVEEENRKKEEARAEAENEEKEAARIEGAKKKDEEARIREEKRMEAAARTEEENKKKETARAEAEKIQKEEARKANDLIIKKGIHQILNSSPEFFNPVTGEAKVWYYITPGGDYEFFDGPGIHPRYGKKLIEITPEAADKYFWDKRVRESWGAGGSSL